MMVNLLSRISLSLLVSLLVVVLAGCSSTSTNDGSHTSRVELYDSVASMAEDSSAVVVGTVSGQRTVADIDQTTHFTLSTITVTSTPKSDGSVAEGSTVIVRQIGSVEQPAPTPLLEIGTTYLLYLTPSGLSGELASQFYITGGNAGLYQAKGSVDQQTEEQIFIQVEKEEGENLPSELTPGQAVK